MSAFVFAYVRDGPPSTRYDATVNGAPANPISGTSSGSSAATLATVSSTYGVSRSASSGRSAFEIRRSTGRARPRLARCRARRRHRSRWRRRARRCRSRGSRRRRRTGGRVAASARPRARDAGWRRGCCPRRARRGTPAAIVPAWRMNHTGTGRAARARHAARKLFKRRGGRRGPPPPGESAAGSS